MKPTGRLFLIPSLLADEETEKQFPVYNKQVISEIGYFIVEELRTARRFLKRMQPQLSIDTLRFAELNEHTDSDAILELLQPLLQGEDGALISEAGLPCVADPGNGLVFMAHQLNVEVIPLVGPSSLLLALMASGFNGQNFAFHGYLPIDKREREQKLKQLERNAWQFDQTQLFIETPYRNKQMIESITRACREETQLCVAANLLSNQQKIVSQTVQRWKSDKTDFHKQPAVFLIYK